MGTLGGVWYSSLTLIFTQTHLLMFVIIIIPRPITYVPTIISHDQLPSQTWLVLGELNRGRLTDERDGIRQAVLIY